MKKRPFFSGAEAVERARALYRACAERPWVRLLAIGWLAFALFVSVIVVLPWRIGVDLQRLIGQPSCLPSLVYVIDYRVTHPPRIGDYAVFRFPNTGYSVGPRPGQKTIKLVMALPGDHVKIEGTELFLRWAHMDRLWLAKSIPGRGVGDFDAQYLVPEGMFFAYGTERESFDSRYFGPVDQRLIVGYARPLF